ncbi:hypothetical protein EDC04DRAFT_2602802 [Pisolithus marmoratus]|nr:hypothetical protein EDC04DRAFT_2602802 [Pisolithus marmoratus]
MHYCCQTDSKLNLGIDLNPSTAILGKASAIAQSAAQGRCLWVSKLLYFIAIGRALGLCYYADIMSQQCLPSNLHSQIPSGWFMESKEKWYIAQRNIGVSWFRTMPYTGREFISMVAWSDGSQGSTSTSIALENLRFGSKTTSISRRGGGGEGTL